MGVMSCDRRGSEKTVDKKDANARRAYLEIRFPLRNSEEYE